MFFFFIVEFDCDYITLIGLVYFCFGIKVEDCLLGVWLKLYVSVAVFRVLLEYYFRCVAYRLCVHFKLSSTWHQSVCAVLRPTDVDR